MERYLIKRKLKIPFLILLSLFIFSSLFSLKSFAKNKKEYYQELFKEDFGFEIYQDSQDSDSSNRYTVILSSELTSEDSPNLGKTVILICDSQFSTEYPFKFNCDTNFANSEQGINMGGFLRNPTNSEVDLFAIPESLLVSPDKRDELGKYLKAIERSDESYSAENTEDGVGSEQENIISKLKVIKDSTMFEFFSISVSMFILSSLAWNTLRCLSSRNRKRKCSSFVKDFLNPLKDTSVYQKIILFVLMIMILVYVPMMLSISIKDGQGINLGYLTSYTSETFRISKLTELADTGSFFRVALFFYGLAFVVLLIAFFIPLFTKVFIRAKQKISQAKINREVSRYCVPILIILSLISVSFFNASEYFYTLVFFLVVLSFLIFKNYLDKEFKYEYSTKEKVIFILASLLIVSSGLLLKSHKKESSPYYNEEDLIGVTDDVVLLPYSKQLGEYRLIKEYGFSGSEPLFVDRYLVYSPSNSKIENKNALEFKNEGTFYIQNGDVLDIVKAVSSNQELLKALTSDSPSNLFRVKNVGNFGELDVDRKIEITFSCNRENLRENKIKAYFYFLDTDGEIQEENKTLLYFPGCSEIDRPETFTVEFNPPYTEDEYLYIRLLGVLPTDIKEINILESDMILEPTYILKGLGYSIISSGGLTTSAIVPVTNYVFGESYNLSFDMVLDDDGEFDISGPINELVKEGVLKDRFLIWSTKKYLPVRLPD